MPSKVSLAINCWRCRAVKISANMTQNRITAGYNAIPTAKPKAAPNKEPWAKVSPKKAMRRHTTKAPMGPLTRAMAKPANRGANSNSIIIRMFHGAGITFGVVMVVMLVLVQGQVALCVGREQGQISGVALHYIGRA